VKKMLSRITGMTKKNSGKTEKKTLENTTKQTWVEWIEPFGPNCEPVYMRTLASTAILVQKQGAAKHGHIYENDMQALEDFIVVNWASIIEK
jgi:hypothetical protein